jgi:pyruvate formate-lyase/glycerol dehydratase family glycyl radical enzyme
MRQEAIVYSPHELRVIRGEAMELTSEEARRKRGRVNRILKRIYRQTPQLSVARAKYFTESFRETEELPLVLRWALGMARVMEKISVYILEDELIVGRGGPPGRYGILYPELEGAYFARDDRLLEQEKGRPHVFAPEDIQVIKEEILPYWKGKTFREALAAMLPEDLKNLLYKDGDIYTPSFIIHETATLRHSIQWCLDYKKILERGFNGIKREAEERLASLDVMNPSNNLDKMPYYKAVIVICDAMKTFAKRHADLARAMANKEKDTQRKQELIEIAEVCERVPAEPARTFREAMQAQWFSQLASRFEQIHGGNMGNGRIDQYLYPFYKKDIEEGRLTQDQAQEFLECLWLNMAQFLRLQPTSAGFLIYEGNAHWEHTTIGGVKPDGSDASNELTYLILQSKKEFPLDYPDLGVRIHSQTPEPLLMAVADLIKEGTGYPKLMNDDEIIPVFLAKGAKLEEARDFTGTGCTEVRLINRNTYFTGTTWINLGSVLEMVLYNGRCTAGGEKQLGLTTGDPRTFKSFDEFWSAFEKQLRFAQKQVFRQQYITDMIRPNKLAAPLLSSLHQLCMEQGKDVNVGRLEGGLSLGGQTGPVGFGTVIDSLAAIRKLVFEDSSVSMDELLDALKNSFKDNEVIRQKCLNAPKYGNGDEYVDELGRRIESILVGMCDAHVNYYGGKPEIFYVPITSHVAMGRVTGSTPNGRKAGEALSEGVSPTQGADVMGPTTTLRSIAFTKNTPYVQRAARLLNIKLSPQIVSGDEGTRKLASFIRAWCDQKHWHLQFNIINRATLLAAQKDSEKYRNLLVRVAGYSAYFVDLSPALQNEIISRTEHREM